MNPSYRIIDYSLRPAKFAERKMLCELFSRLKSFGTLESYRYIGFGSIWFADCVAMHRTLGINDIISIEREIDEEDRFIFNNPYKGISLVMGEAADVLPGLEWNQRSVIWLDYDDFLSPATLDDVRTVASRAATGTALAVSVQAEQLYDKRDIHDEPKKIETPDQFRDLFGVARTPTDMENASLRGWTLSKTSRQVICSEIDNTLKQVNTTRSAGQHLQFKKIASFEYSDGAKMTTVVGVIIDEGQNGVFESCSFRDLPYFSENLEAFRIKVPLLTPTKRRF